MLIYSPTKSPQSLFFYFLYSYSSHLVFFFSPYRNSHIYCRNTKVCNVRVFQYHAALTCSVSLQNDIDYHLAFQNNTVFLVMFMDLCEQASF